MIFWIKLHQRAVGKLKKDPKIDVHFVGGYRSANIWEKDKIVSHSQVHTNRTFLERIGMLESLFRFYGPG